MMDFIVKTIRRLGLIAIPAVVLYLASNGELGANETTAIATISPTLLVVVTYMYEALRWILPKAILGLLWNHVSKHIGEANTATLKDMSKNISFGELLNKGAELIQSFNELKETATLIREDQVANQ